MKKSIIALMIGGLSFTASAQTVSSFLGQPNPDPFSYWDAGTIERDSAYFYQPEDIVFDANGYVYVSNFNNIRLVSGPDVYTRSGAVGNPSFSHGYHDGTALAGDFYNPRGIVCDSENRLWIMDTENHAIRRLTAFTNLGNAQQLTTWAGIEPQFNIDSKGESGYKNDQRYDARVNEPQMVAKIPGKDEFYFTEKANRTVRKIDVNGNVTFVAGTPGKQGYADGPISKAEFYHPYGVAFLDENTLLVTDIYNYCIRKIDLKNATVTTLTGDPGSSKHQDGKLDEARFQEPRGITVVDGRIYVSDLNTIRVIDPADSTVSTLAGDPNKSGNVNGVGSNAQFGWLIGMASYKGDLYVTDGLYHVIKKVSIDNLKPTADFNAAPRNVEVNEDVVLTDNSTGPEGTGWNWTIQKPYKVESGAVDESSVTVSFTQAGFYDVSLQVSNSFGNSTKSKTAYIAVSNTGHTVYHDNGAFKIYPNPSNNWVHFSLEGSNNLNGATISLYNPEGKALKTEKVENTITSINVSDFKSGVYYLTLEHKDNTYIQKLIIH